VALAKAVAVRTAALAGFAAAMALHGAVAAPLSRVDVPDPLKAWIPWVLQGNETIGCAPAHDGSTARRRPMRRIAAC
jgi:hypothetical protein